jgi:hypothetical protein
VLERLDRVEIRQDLDAERLHGLWILGPRGIELQLE